MTKFCRMEKLQKESFSEDNKEAIINLFIKVGIGRVNSPLKAY